jgi:hypothetical protein
MAGVARTIRALVHRLRPVSAVAEYRSVHRGFQGAIAEAAKRGLVDLSLVSVDSTTVRAHHDAAGMIMEPETLDALEKAAAEKGAPARNKTGNLPRNGKNDDA